MGSPVLSLAAQSELNRIESKSALKQKNEKLRAVEWKDVNEFACAGHGCFSNVFKVQVNASGMETKDYALKRLALDGLKTHSEMASAASDLVAEGEILSRLDHENIIRLHGVASGGPCEAFQDTEPGYFLILDLLEETLSDRLKTIRKKDKGIKGYFRGGSSSFANFTDDVLGIAKGIEYLHVNNIILRDLKPDNIGYDSEGKVKLFDLGLAREAHMIEREDIAGSLRYMAPEVALGIGTELASDVYSFGILLWELCTLEVPFNYFKTRADFIKGVIYDGQRPSLARIRSNALRILISQCWSEDPKDRPKFDQIVSLLQRELPLADFSKAIESSDGISDDLSVGSSSSTIGSRSKKIGTSIKNLAKLKPLKKNLRRSISEPLSRQRGIESNGKSKPSRAARAA